MKSLASIPLPLLTAFCCTLCGAADDLGEPGKDPYFGHGRINALGAVE